MSKPPPVPPEPAGEPEGRAAWVLIGALAVAQTVTWGAIYYGFSLFVLPMEADLGWSRTDLNSALSLGLLAMSAASYPVGAWIDRHGGRAVMTLGSITGVVLLVVWSQIDNLSVFYAVWIGLGAAMAATLYEPVFVVINRLFVRSYRQKIAAVTLVAGFASTVFIPLTQVLIAEIGWRQALLVLAAIVAVICLPVHAFVLRDAPVADPTGTAIHPPAAGWPVLRLALLQPVFWGLFCCFTLYSATFSALTFHLVPLLTERGLGASAIMGAMATIGPAQVAGRVALITIGKRLTVRVVGLGVMIAMPVSVVILWLMPGSAVALFSFAVVYGAANGLFTIVRSTAVPDLMQREGYGTINGALGVPMNLAKAAAPLAGALIWAAAGGYDAMLVVVIVGGVLAALAFAVATRFKRADDVR